MSSKSRRVRLEHNYPVRTTAVAGIVGLGVALLATAASAASIKSVRGKDGRVNVQIIGEITAGDAEVFIDLVKRANEAGKFVANVRLNSMGGNLLEGVKLVDAVRTGKMSTNVGQNAVCASACFLAFAAGETKFATYGAQIGVHGASDQTGRETLQSGAATVSMARIAKELGVPPAIIGRMVVTPPSEIVWLSPQDLQSMGVTMVGKPSQVSRPQDGPVARQTAPGEPMQLEPAGSPTAPAETSQPQQTTKASGTASWETLTNNAFDLSRQQNGGTPKTLRSCQPQSRVCTTGIMFKMNGTDTVLLSRQNLDGKVTERELCTFNNFGDIRSCMDWDTKATHRDMKDNKGEWTKVSD